jgi:hypothetical protein
MQQPQDHAEAELGKDRLRFRNAARAPGTPNLPREAWTMTKADMTQRHWSARA